MLSQNKKYFSSSSNEGSSPENNSKKKRLTNFEKKQFSLPKELQEMLIGLLLGDVYAQKRGVNTNLFFEQGIKNKNYLFHLFDLFKNYCRSEPKISERLPDKRTGKVYTRVLFTTYSLPCFNELQSMFYPKGKKIVPLNIEELLTPLGLAYWICDDGTYCKKHKYIRLATNSFTLQEVELLLGVLRTKFNLDCYIVEDRSGYVTTITARSVLDLQPILKPIMPISMMHKIGL
jgi:LAGLIDADG DNA endonuclease family